MSYELTASLLLALTTGRGLLNYVDSCGPHGVVVIGFYHDVGADTKVIDPMAEGTDECAKGLVWAAS